MISYSDIFLCALYALPLLRFKITYVSSSSSSRLIWHSKRFFISPGPLPCDLCCPFAHA